MTDFVICIPSKSLWNIKTVDFKIVNQHKFKFISNCDSFGWFLVHEIITQFLLLYQRSTSLLPFLYWCRQHRCIWTQLQSKRHQTRCRHFSFSLGQIQKSESWSEILKQQNLQDIPWGLHIFQKCLGLMFSNKL